MRGSAVQSCRWDVDVSVRSRSGDKIEYDCCIARNPGGEVHEGQKVKTPMGGSSGCCNGSKPTLHQANIRLQNWSLLLVSPLRD